MRLNFYKCSAVKTVSRINLDSVSGYGQYLIDVGVVSSGIIQLLLQCNSGSFYLSMMVQDENILVLITKNTH